MLKGKANQKKLHPLSVSRLADLWSWSAWTFCPWSQTVIIQKTFWLLQSTSLSTLLPFLQKIKRPQLLLDVCGSSSFSSERLHGDQGCDFESQIIKELCTLLGIKKIRTSPYYPRGNPWERFNCTLLGMLGTLKAKQKTKWHEYVKPLTHAYNCTRNEVTGFSPYELMFGRQPRLPIDIAFGLPIREGSSTSHSQYVKNLKSYLTEYLHSCPAPPRT